MTLRIKKTKPNQTKYHERENEEYVVGKYNKREAELRVKRPDGKWRLIQDVYPSAFVRNREVERLPDNDFIKDIKTETNRHSRIILHSEIRRKDIDELIDQCRYNKVFLMEADADPIRRWFSDTGANMPVHTKALFFDLETWPLQRGFDDEAKKKHMIISVACGDVDGNFWFEYNETCDEEGEAKLINKFLDIADDYDTLLAWNGQDYDFYVLRHRCYNLKIKVDWRNWNCLDYMLVVKKCLMSVTDKTFKRSFALDNIGFNVLGIRKMKIDVDMGRMDKLIREKRVAELRAYNARDVEIMIRLEKSREFLDLHLTVCKLCKQFPNHLSIHPNVLGDGLMLREAVLQDRHFRSRYSEIEETDEEKYSGGFVMDSVVGFHEDVQVVDFSSLYPTIMISFNMSPETKLHPDRNYDSHVFDSAATCPSTGIKFRTDYEGILSRVLRELLETRKIYKTKEKNATMGSPEWKRYGQESTAIKVVANSMYGLHGSHYTRYYDRDIAESITTTAQYFTRSVIQFSEEELGYQVVHADTDSAFLKAPIGNVPEIVDRINSELIQIICDKCNCRVNIVNIDSDKGYSTFLIQRKKKYCGRLSTHKGRPAPKDMAPEIKGLEFQRPDAVPFAQEMQYHFLNLLLEPDVEPNEIEIELRKWADRFLEMDLTLKEIEIRQAVKKQPKDYKPMTAAAKAAQQLIDNGYEFFVGMKVGYVITSHGKTGLKVTPTEMFDGHFDRNYYWTNKIVGPTARLIRARFQGHDFHILDSLEKMPSQQTLVFDNNFDEVEMSKRLPLSHKTKKNKHSKLVKTTNPKLKSVTLSLHEKDDPTENTLVGIKKLAEVSEGHIRLKFSIITKEGTADISTNHKINNDFLDEIKKYFPWVQISEVK